MVTIAKTKRNKKLGGTNIEKDKKKFIEVKDLIGDVWLDHKCEYFHRLSKELFACWLYLKVYPEHGTLNANFPPIEKEPVCVTKPEDLMNPEILKISKIIPWEQSDRKKAFDKDIENFVRNRLKNSDFITDKMISFLQDHPDYVVDIKFLKELNHKTYDLYPFGFDYRKSESFLNLSIVSNKMFVLYNILRKIKIENSKKDCIATAKDLVTFTERCVSHELIVDANLLFGYYIGRGLISLRRTKKSNQTKEYQRAIKERYVIDAYTKMVNNKEEKAILENLSEIKMAQRVKQHVEATLRKVKTPNHRSVLKPKWRNNNVTFTGLSTKTIIDILRKRDKERLHFYPWENKDASRT